MISKPIKPNFRIPKGYNRFFYLEERGTDFKMFVSVDRSGIRMGGAGRASKKGNSRSFDWIAYCIEFVRQDCARKLSRRKKK